MEGVLFVYCNIGETLACLSAVWKESVEKGRYNKIYGGQ